MLFCVVDITIGGPAATAQDFGIIDRLVFKVSGITLSSALELYCTVILISLSLSTRVSAFISLALVVVLVVQNNKIHILN